jgi:hypothetical protein
LRTIPEMQGEAYFSSKTFNKDLLGFQDSLKNDLYSNPAIIPPMPWLDDIPPQAISKLKRRGRKVKWESLKTENELDKAWQYVIYLNELGEKFNHEDSKFTYAVQKEQEIKLERRNRKRKKYEVRISVLDRLNNESKVSLPVEVKL